MSAGHGAERVRAAPSPGPAHRILPSCTPRHCLAHAHLESCSTAESLCCGDCPLLLPPPWYGNSPGKELAQAQLQRAASTSCHSTWHCRDTGLAEQMCWVRAATNLHRSINWGKSFTCPGPDFVQKGWSSQCSNCLWQSPAPRAHCSCGSLWMEVLWVTFPSQSPSRKSIPAKLQRMSLGAILSHNT